MAERSNLSNIRAAGAEVLADLNVRARDATANAIILGYNGTTLSAAPAISFGAAYDTILYRGASAGSLITDGSLQAASLRIGATSAIEGQFQALAGSSGTPATGNRFVTELDPRITALAGSSQIVYTQTIGDGAATTFTLAHNLGTRTLLVQVYQVGSPFALVEPNIEKTTLNTVTVSFENYVPAASEFIVYIMAPGGAAVPVSAVAATALPVGETGQVGQARAGRALTVADFTTLMGLSTPVGLFNLDSTTNLGSGGALVNKGTVTFASGIAGVAGGAAQFTGSASQGLYIADTGAADPFRIATGSWGCWFRTAKRGLYQAILSKESSADGNRCYDLQVSAGNTLVPSTFPLGTQASVVGSFGTSDVADDRWHFGVGTYDGSVIRTYVDGALEGTVASAGIFAGSGPVNVGGIGADSSTAPSNPHFGRVDEAFITADVLSPEQVRLLYAVKIPHTLSAATPRSVNLAVRRRRRGAVLASADFPTAPLRLYSNVGDGADLGTNAVNLGGGGVTGVFVAGPDGGKTGAAGLTGGSYAASDTGLPSGLASRSYGMWFKTAQAGGALMSWGSVASGYTNLALGSGQLGATSYTDNISGGPIVNDGQWHFALVVDDNAAVDGVKRKLYSDGRLVGGSTVMNSIVLGGSTTFRIGANPDGSSSIAASLARAFVTSYVLTPADIAALYNKGSQDLGLSPKNPGSHIERIDTTNIYFVGDTLGGQNQIDLTVVA